MKRLVLVALILMSGIVYADDGCEADQCVILASISSKQNLLGIDATMGASSGGAAGHGPSIALETGDVLLMETGDRLLLE